MPTIQRIFRCRIDWLDDQRAAHEQWLKDLEHAEDNDLPHPEECQVMEEIGAEIDEIVAKFPGVEYSNNGGGPCWNAYIILEGELEYCVHRCATLIEDAIQNHRYCKLLEDK